MEKEKEKEYFVLCRFSAVGRVVIKASNQNEAARKAQSMADFRIDEIIKVLKPCVVEGVFLNDDYYSSKFSEYYNYKNWGSE